MKKYIFTMILLTQSHAVFSHDGNNGWVTANNFQLWSNTYGSDQIRVMVGDGIYNPAGAICSDLDSYMVSTTISKEAQQRIYSTLLSAVMANKSVRLSIDTNGCEGVRPKINTVVIQ